MVVIIYACILYYVHDVGSCGCGTTCEDEAYEVGDDFEGDNPPRVGNVDFGHLALFGVVDDAHDFVAGYFDFHSLCFFFRCKDMKKATAGVALCRRLGASG